MLTISKLNLEPLWHSRTGAPQKSYHIHFRLTPRSEYLLTEEARCLNSKEELASLERGITESVNELFFTMPLDEFKPEKLGALVRTQIDPTDKSRLFGIQFKRGESDDELFVTNVKVLKHADPKSYIAESLKSLITKVRTHEYTQPIVIRYLLDEKSIRHLLRLENEYDDRSELDTLRNSIQRAIGQWAYDNKNTKMLIPGGQFIVKAEDPLTDDKEYRFAITTVTGKNLIVRQLRVDKIEAF